MVVPLHWVSLISKIKKTVKTLASTYRRFSPLTISHEENNNNRCMGNEIEASFLPVDESRFPVISHEETLEICEADTSKNTARTTKHG